MKRTAGALLAFLLLVSFNIPASAMEVPSDVSIQTLDGVRQYIKTYTVAPDTAPQSLIESPFDYEGCTYTYSGMTKAENVFTDTQTHSETVTVETDDDDLSAVLEALSPSIEFSDGRYSGTLNLDHTTIHTEPAGYETLSYTVSATKEIGELDSNDMSYVPATTVKDGVTIQLQSVDWHVQSTALVDDVLVPSQYKAVATYSGTAYYSAATGYITTAEYVGEISCSELESITYTVTYIGEPIEEIAEPSDADASAEETSHFAIFNYHPYVLGGLGIAAIVLLSAMLLRARSELRALEDEAEEAGIEEVNDDEA